MLNKNIDGKTIFFRSKLLSVALLVGVVGTIVTLVSNAEGSSTISGTVFHDTNRNGVQDAGETPMVGQGVVLVDAAGLSQIGYTSTDASGRYTFAGLADANYQVEYDGAEWFTIRNEWVPTTTGSIYPKKVITLTGQATVNFGWRQIVRSANENTPLSSYTAPNGLKLRSYNDAFTATELYSHILEGSLITQEAPYTTVYFDLETNSAFTGVTVSGGPGNYTNYTASVTVPYISLLDNGDHVLFHEYGHAWSLYHGYITAQNTDFVEYLKLRGIANDPRLGSSHGWSTWELIAEDYRQLFGSPSAQQVSQENRDLPPAKYVSGLREYLSGAFMQSNIITPPPPPPDTIAPTAPSNLVGQSVSTSEGISINLSWQASTDNVGVTKYLIYRNGVLVNSVNSPGTKFIDTDINANTTYQYYLKAVDAAGNTSVASPTITVNTGLPDTQAPTAPTNLTSPTQTQTSIALKWNPSTDNVGVTNYRIYKIGGSRKNSFNTLIATTSSTTYTVTGLTKGTAYSFYVVAVDTANNSSSPSSTLTVKTRR